jgi:hypothetical protein
MENVDLDRMKAHWFENQDCERAVREGKDAFVYLRSGPTTASEMLAIMETAIDPVCDGPGGDSRLAYDVALASEAFLVDSEKHVPGLPERLELRSRNQFIIARAGYRAGFEPQAFVTTLALLGWVEKQLEGPQGMLAALKSSLSNAGAASAVRALGLYPAALRRTNYTPALKAHFLGFARPYVEAYAEGTGHSGMPVRYDRAHAVHSQWLLALLREAPDDPLIPRLRALERASRPANARGRATEPLLGFELARRAGDPVEVDRLRAEADARLRDFPLERHLKMVEQQGYLAA